MTFFSHPPKKRLKSFGVTRSCESFLYKFGIWRRC